MAPAADWPRVVAETVAAKRSPRVGSAGRSTSVNAIVAGRCPAKEADPNARDQGPAQRGGTQGGGHSQAPLRREQGARAAEQSRTDHRVLRRDAQVGRV